MIAGFPGILPWEWRVFLYRLLTLIPIVTALGRMSDVQDPNVTVFSFSLDLISDQVMKTIYYSFPDPEANFGTGFRVGLYLSRPTLELIEKGISKLSFILEV